jgi:hypothetical protein
MHSNDALEKFIRENRDKFSDSGPRDNHSANFLYKLNHKIRQINSIVPYLVKVAVATVLIFGASVLIWNNYIRKDRYHISLKDKISLVIYKIKMHHN